MVSLWHARVRFKGPQEEALSNCSERVYCCIAVALFLPEQTFPVSESRCYSGCLQRLDLENAGTRHC
jgi:hypothetical protein